MSAGEPDLGTSDGFRGLSAAWRGGSLTIGNFDGVHLGHQALLRRCVDRARPVVALTFDPHPLSVLAPDRAPALLTPMAERIARLRAAGAAGVVVVRPDAAFLGLSAAEFVREVIVGRIAPRVVVEGRGFRFGHDRAGDVEQLRILTRAAGIEVEVVEPVRVRLPDEAGETVVSSSAVRKWLLAGRVAAAAAALGRPYALLGKVVEGERVGRTLGFPTINVEISGQLVPGDGVYGGTAVIAGRSFRAAISVGRRETFGGDRRHVEAFLLDVEGDWYGSTVRLEFVAWVRAQQRFDSPAALTAQITHDVAAIRAAVSPTEPMEVA